MLLPGADAIYLSQSLKFLKPVRFGDTVTAMGEVTKIIPEKKLFYAKVAVTNQKGEIVKDILLSGCPFVGFGCSIIWVWVRWKGFA
jgi:acyl dehydratase